MKDYGKFMGQLQSVDKSIQGLGDTGESASGGLKKFGLAVAAAALAAATAAAGIAVAATKVATDWEDAFADVVRTTNDLGDEFGTLTPLGEEVLRGLRDIALQIPVSMDTLTDVAAIAGKMNIAEKDIVAFTEVMVRMADVTDLSATQASAALAQFAAIMGTSGPDIERLASTIVALGNSFPPSEAAIVRMIPRLAFLGKQAGLSEVDVLALATAAQTLGFRSEAASTAFVRAFLKMGNAVASGNDDLAVFAKASQMTVEEFVRLFKTDAIGAYMAFVAGLGEQTAMADGYLHKLGLASARYEMVTLGLAASQDVLIDAWQVANRAWKENTALAVESQRKYGTLAKALDRLGNIGQDVLGSIGIPFREMLKGWLADIIPVAEAFAKDLPDAIEQHLIPRLAEFNRIVREDIVPWLKNMWEWIKNSLVPALESFGKAIGNLINFIKPLIDTIKGFRGESILLGLIMARLIVLAVDLYLAFGELKALMALMGGVSGVVSGGLVGIKAALVGLASSTVVWTAAVVALIAVIDRLKTAFDNIDEAIGRAHGNLDRWVSATTKMISDGTSLSSVITTMASATNKAADAWDNMNLAQQAFVKVFGKTSDYTDIMEKRQREVQIILLKNTTSWKEYTQAVYDYNSQVKDASLMIPQLTRAQREALLAVRDWIEAQYEEIKAKRESIGVTEEAIHAWNNFRGVEGALIHTHYELTGATEQLDSALEDAMEATNIFKTASEELQKAEQAGIITTAERIAMEQGLQLALGLTSQAAINAIGNIKLLTIAMMNGVLTAQQFVATLNALAGGSAQLDPNIRNLAKVTGGLKDVTEETTAATNAAGGAGRSYADVLREQRQALQDVIIGHLELAERLVDPEATTIARIGIEDLRQAYEKGQITFEDYATGLEQIQDSFGLVTPESRKLANNIGRLKVAMSKGFIKAEDYDDILMEIFKRTQEGTLDIAALFEEFGIAPEAIDPAGEAVDEFGNKLEETPIEEAKRKLMELPTTLDTVQAAYSTAGPAMVNSFAAGFFPAMDALIAQMRAKWQEAADLVHRSEPKDPTSPLRGMEKSGALLVETYAKGVNRAGPNLIDAFSGIFETIIGDISDGSRIIGEGFKDIGDDFDDMIDRIIDLLPDFTALIDKIAGDMEALFDAASVFGAFGEAAADMYEEQFLDPLKEELEEVDELLEDLTPPEGMSFKDWWTGGWFQSGARDRDALLERRAELVEEIAANEERILKLQEKQQQLDFLQTQFDLLELIKEHGLDASEILGGLKLGVDADLAAVIAAMVKAMSQIVDKVNEELQISSPSAVFAKIGENMMAGLVAGWVAGADKAQGIMGASLVPAPVSMAPVSGGAGNVSNSQDIRFDTTINNGMDAAQFEQRVLRVVRGDMV